MTMPLIPALALPALIACVDSSEDALLLLRDRMVDAGYRAVTFCSPIRYGPQPVIDFVTYLAPQAVIYSVSPPYSESWAEHLALARAVPEIPHVAVTINKAALERVIGQPRVLEVLATDGDLEPLVAEIRGRLASDSGGVHSSDGQGQDGRQNKPSHALLPPRS